MADQLEVFDLERDTFAMLVGEEALDGMVDSGKMSGLSFTQYLWPEERRSPRAYSNAS